MFESTLEKIALKAWPAFENLEMDSWILRFANGYTKRANSVTVLGDCTTNLETKIISCEKQFQQRNLKSVFRLPSFISPNILDKTLEQRGYEIVEPTFVMQKSLEDWQPQFITISNNKVCEWLNLYKSLSGASGNHQDNHLKILKSISSETRFCSYQHQNESVSCGLGVLENTYFGLFDLLTNQKHRRKGYAQALILGMLDWAKNREANTAYLQVVQNNVGAVQLYKNLGFTKQYEYWYRVKSN